MWVPNNDHLVKGVPTLCNEIKCAIKQLRWIRLASKSVVVSAWFETNVFCGNVFAASLNRLSNLWHSCHESWAIRHGSRLKELAHTYVMNVILIRAGHVGVLVWSTRKRWGHRTWKSSNILQERPMTGDAADNWTWPWRRVLVLFDLRFYYLFESKKSLQGVILLEKYDVMLLAKVNCTTCWNRRYHKSAEWNRIIPLKFRKAIFLCRS